MSRKKGKNFEEVAANYLRKQGYQILEQNWHAGLNGEIDLICLLDNLLVFIEVKGRGSDQAYSDAMNAINKSKAKKLLLSMQLYLAAYDHDGPVRCDLIVVLAANHEVYHIPDINLWDV
jgi:putative endonuclease